MLTLAPPTNIAMLKDVAFTIAAIKSYGITSTTPSNAVNDASTDINTKIAPALNGGAHNNSYGQGNPGTI